jgi:hypothetical protein
VNVPVLVVLVAAAACATMAGWLAADRARNRAVWTLFGGLLGPVGIALLLLAPPGACPTCDMPTQGWPSQCRSCGHSFGTEVPENASLGGTAPDAPSAPDLGGAWRQADAGGGRMAGHSPVHEVSRPFGTESAGGSGVTGPMPWGGSRPVATASGPFGTRVAPPSGRSAAGVEGPLTRGSLASLPADRLQPGTQVVAVGVYIAGAGPIRAGVSLLQIGDRYGIARSADEIQVLGPVHLDPERILARIPASGLEASLEADRLLLRWPSKGTASLAFGSVALPAGPASLARLEDPSSDGDDPVP